MSDDQRNRPTRRKGGGWGKETGKEVTDKAKKRRWVVTLDPQGAPYWTQGRDEANYKGPTKVGVDGPGRQW